MHDSQEAGKYLFLSGLAEHREEEWVELFLSSVRGKPCEWIFSRFPSAGRKASLADYPERVQTGLKSLGFPDDFRNKNGSLALPVEKLSKFKETMVVAIALTIFLLMLLGLFNGLTVVGRWIFGK
ncbi:MAG: hypothetical protein ACKVY0_08600 [Prosthecobacter sp.]|uniref:hypothetical protein n=1 Tax=Prosthecobacter sp. TaxID=1965333 RepID=UPI003901266E